MQFTVKYVFKGRRSGDGCYVDVREMADGGLSLTLRSNHNPDEVVDERIIDKRDLAQALDAWVDY